jgi:hypothetical protein
MKEEVEQLWADLKGAHQNSLEIGKADQNNDYFLGPIVIVSPQDGGSGLAHVVDGQQRLTTLHTFLWCAYRRLLNDGSSRAIEKREELNRLLPTARQEPSLAVARGDQTNLLALREGTQLDVETDLGVTGKFLRDQVLSFGTNLDLISFVEYLLDKVIFVLVETDGFGSAWDLFIGLNGKGRPLTPADLIKAFVCGKSPDSIAMADIWAEAVLPLGSDATSALLDTVRVGTGEVGSDARLFKMFEKAWNANQVTATLLSDASRLYRTIWQLPIDQVPNLTVGRRALRGLRQLGRRDHTPVLIAVGNLHGSEAIVDTSLLQALEAYQLWMGVSGKRGRERNFTALASRIYRELLSLDTCRFELAKLLREQAPTPSDALKAVENATYPGTIMSLIIRQYEEGMRGDIMIDDFQREHMMPDTPTDYWYGVTGTRDLAQYRQIVNKIGNITPLDPATNNTVKNHDWATKCRWYTQNVPNWLVSEIARQNADGWTPGKIAARSLTIAEWAVSKRWNLTERLSQLAAASIGR